MGSERLVCGMGVVVLYEETQPSLGYREYIFLQSQFFTNFTTSNTKPT